MAQEQKKLTLTDVVNHLREGNVQALQNVGKGLIMQATAELAKAARARGIGVKVYAESGSIGITGIRTRPIVAYKSEWEAIRTYMENPAFQSALEDPQCSTGSDDPRFEGFRAKAKVKREAERDAKKA